MENKLLTETKDEYAREKKYRLWNDFFWDFHYKQPTREEVEELADTIATRYAAKENEGLIRDVKNLRSAALNYLDCQFNAKDKSVSEIINAGTELRNILSKTAHYDNQNTDV